MMVNQWMCVYDETDGTFCLTICAVNLHLAAFLLIHCHCLITFLILNVGFWSDGTNWGERLLAANTIRNISLAAVLLCQQRL